MAPRDNTAEDQSESTSIQKWGSYDHEEAERDKRETESKGTFFKITKEKTTLRFLPPRRGMKNPFVKTYQHFTNLVEGDDRTTVVFNCPKKMLNQFCPLCAMADKKKLSGLEADRERAYELYPKLRVYSAVIDRNDLDKGVQIFPFGKKILEQLLSIRDDGDFTNPTDKGFDIRILKQGTNKKTTYLVKAARDGSPLSADPEEFNEWIDALPDLVQYAVVPNREEMENKMAAAMEASEADDSPPQPRQGRLGDGGGRREHSRGRGEGRERPIEAKGETVSEDVWGDDDEDDIPY